MNLDIFGISALKTNNGCLIILVVDYKNILPSLPPLVKAEINLHYTKSAIRVHTHQPCAASNAHENERKEEMNGHKCECMW